MAALEPKSLQVKGSHGAVRGRLKPQRSLELGARYNRATQGAVEFEQRVNQLVTWDMKMVTDGGTSRDVEVQLD